MSTVVAQLRALLSLDVSEFSQGANEAGGITDRLGGSLGGLAAGLGGLAAAAGIAGGGIAAFGAMFSEAMDLEAAQGRLKAQLGLTAEESERYGRIAGDLYTGAYGDSMEGVNDALRFVTQNIGDMAGQGEDALKNVTATAMDFASAFDEDIANATRTAGVMIKSGLVPDATAAFDVLTKGFQNGANASDDLLDTFTEYSVIFTDLGVSADMALGLISQGMQAGARDSDYLADAIKEFAIRSKDIDAAGDAFKALGLDAKKTVDVFAKGGPEANKAMADVIKRLKEMPDATERNRLAVELFGTKAEDLQDALFALDPTTAVASLGEVGGAAAQMSDDLNNNAMVRLESFKRTLKMGLVGFMKDTILPGVVGAWDEVSGAWTAGIAAFSAGTGDITSGGLAGVFEQIGSKAREVWDKVEPIFTELKGGWTALVAAFQSGSDDITSGGFAGAMEQIGVLLRKATDAFSAFWSKIEGNEALLITFGYILGVALVAGVVAITAALWSMAAAVIAATWPFVLAAAVIFGIVVAVKYAYENFEWFRTGVQAVVAWLQENVPPAFEAIKAAVQVAFDWIANVALPWAQEAFASFTGFLNDTFLPAAKVVFEVWWNYIQFVFGIVMEIVQRAANFISDNWNWIAGIASAIWSQIGNIISTAWAFISNIIQLFLNIIQGNWSGAWDNVKAILGAAVGFLVNTVRNFASGFGNVVMVVISAAGNMAGAVAGKLYELRNWFQSLPGQILSAVGNLGGLLLQAGKDILAGLIRGVKSKIGELRDQLSRVTGLIPSWKGPLTRDRRLLEPSGAAIMGGLIRGILGRLPALREGLGQVTATMSGGMAAAAAEIARHVARGGSLFEDFTFRGMSDNVAKWNDKIAALFFEQGPGRKGDWFGRNSTVGRAEWTAGVGGFLNNLAAQPGQTITVNVNGRARAEDGVAVVSSLKAWERVGGTSWRTGAPTPTHAGW